MKAFVLPCLAVLLPVISAAADVSGAWTGTIGGPMYIILKQEGTVLSGSGGTSATEQIATFKDGRVEGDRLIFRVGPYQFDLQVQGDRITGESKMGDQTTKVFLRRVDSLPKRTADTPLPTFEVASVKPAPPPIGGINSSMNASPGRLTAVNVTIKKLMARAYGVKDYQIAGPDWLNT
ncbi:MAG TPA: TIGR03435 family protein, partial [Candidatus Acidoferrum sp.]|nr:TIGR03435 family protein [Candidatus Acidoferrum sp.]